MKLKTSFLFLNLLLTTSFVSFSQVVTNHELLTILDIKTFRVPSFSNKQWTIGIIPDTLQKGKPINIAKKLSSKTSSLIAVKFDNDTTLSFTLIQNENRSSKGTFNLKNNRYDIEWNNFPEYLYKNTFVIGTISYEQNEKQPMKTLKYLLIVQLTPELKF